MIYLSAYLCLSALFLYLGASDGKISFKATEWRSEYDYIVVGAGSSGSVVANRLSESPDQQVLLLEAGIKGLIIAEIPVFAGALQLSRIDWAYKTEPQENACFGLVNRSSSWARGKVLGGSSVLNYMLYVRGNKRDYDNWEKEGAAGWAWKDVLPYFLKSEDMTDAELLANGYHASGGPLTVTTNTDPNDIGRALPEAGRYLGYTGTDYNGATQAGFAIAQANIRGGSRCSTARAYLKPASRRTNLDILVEAFATKLIFNREKRAIGVQFQRDGTTHIVRARKEVILSAGAINTPHLLMLSGIGPREHLQKLGIPVLADLPVGDNLQDHIYTGGLHFTVGNTLTLNKRLARLVAGFGPYLTLGRGPLTVPGGVEGLAFVKTKFANMSDDWPDVEIHLVDGIPTINAGKFFKRAQGISDYLWKSAYDPYVRKDAFTLCSALLHPKSRGNIRLRSSDPHDRPLIDPKYLSEDDDIKTIVEAIKLSIAVGLSPAYKKLGSEILETVIPGCEIYKMWSDEYLACMARTNTQTFWHFSGTCRMGSPRDPRSVVDPELRVLGVQGLRVIDASVMPVIVSGNTNAACVMIGEKGADLIKGKLLPPAVFAPAKSANVSEKVFPLPQSLEVDPRRQEEIVRSIVNQLRTAHAEDTDANVNRSQLVLQEEGQSFANYGRPAEYAIMKYQSSISGLKFLGL